MTIPYIGFSNSTLDSLPDLKAGDTITCPSCGEQHKVEASNPPLLLFYACGDKEYLAGVRGKNTVGVRADVASGRSSED